MAAEYHYISTWQLSAQIERVWAAISDLEQLSVWYPGVHEVQILTPGDDQGVGARVRYGIKGRLPMRLVFEATIARVDPPRELELRAEGDLVGTGRWLLDQEGEVTTVRYLWDVHTTRPWMNLIAPVARPLFTWNSRGVMLEAGQGLARHLKVPLVEAEFTAPAWPAARPLRWAVLAASVGWLLARRGRSARQHGRWRSASP
ncbi:MAG: SRPBCC family protein [Gemmatimonadales bacterium]